MAFPHAFVPGIARIGAASSLAYSQFLVDILELGSTDREQDEQSGECSHGDTE
jgi:hypothetical protein